ncbi:hypothetical protein FSP39_000056, partial [Pinctada imbricata]
LISQIYVYLQASEYIQQHGLTSYFEQPNITAFIPSTEFFLSFDATMYGINMQDKTSAMELFLYHIGSGIVRTEDFQDDVTMRSKHPAGYALRLNIFNDDHGQQIYTVNGASILVSDVIASNGVLHIIDGVIAPVMSPKTIHDYTLYPDMPGLQFTSIARASIINPELKRRTNSTEYSFTSLAPHDNVLFPMPNYGQDLLFGDLLLLNETILAHIAPDKVRFIPKRGRIPKMKALKGELTFTRENGNVYVTNHMVRAKITHFNIPVINGVMHVLDNLLYFVYQNIVNTVKNSIEMSVFASYMDKIPLSYLSFLQGTDTNFTMFVPVNDSFANLPPSVQQQILADQQLVSDVVGTHIISSGVIDSSQWYNGISWRTINNKTLQIKTSNGEQYLQFENVKAQILRKDIRCTNGIIHLVSHVLLKSTFSILDAIKENPQLSEMTKALNDYPELEHMGGITIFAPSDQVLMRLGDQASTMLEQNQTVLIHELTIGKRKFQQTHIIKRTSVSRDNLQTGVYYYLNFNFLSCISGFTVEGNHITANVIRKNIWCSNGILHIIDNLLHIPIRNVMEEIRRYPEISFISSFLNLETMKELSTSLQQLDNSFTLFIPLNSAFSNIPRSRADKLLSDTNLLQQVLKAHISPSGSRYLKEMIDGDSYPAEEEVLHVAKNSSHVYVVNNNVRTRIITSNIRALNGIIHIVDSLLYFPYYTVAEMMHENAIFRMFYDMIKALPDFLQWSQDESIQMTVFAPSSEYLNNLGGEKLRALVSDYRVVRQHKIDNSDNQKPKAYKFRIKQEQKQTNKNLHHMKRSELPICGVRPATLTPTVDVGYSNLRMPVDVDRDGVACSNGVIFPIHGFLDISFRSVLEEMQNQEKLKVSLPQILKVFPDEVADEFRQADKTFTVFMPADEAFLYLSYYESVTLTTWGIRQKNTRVSFSSDIFWCNLSISFQILGRHVINGSILTFQHLVDMKDKVLSDSNVTVRHTEPTDCPVNRSCDGVLFLEWNGISSKVIQANILGTNGIIHVLDHVLFKAEEPTTVKPPPTAPSSINSCNIVQLNSYLLTVLIMLSIMIVRR